MSGTQGQASVEWAGLLAVIAVIAAGLVLIAGPPLVAVVRGTLVAALSGRSSTSAPLVATAADIGDVETALGPRDTALTPDAALLALAQRHGSDGARAVAGAILLEIARRRSPALGRGVTYGGEDENGRRETFSEAVTGPVVARWVTVEDHRAALEERFAHHTSPLQFGLDVLSLVPGGKLFAKLGDAEELGRTGFRTVFRVAASKASKGFGTLQDAEGLAGIAAIDDRGVPGGLLTGDVVVSWPVHVMGTISGPGPGSHKVAPLDYRRRVFLRPSGAGLAVVGVDATS